MSTQMYIYIYYTVQVTNLRGPSDYTILKLQSSTIATNAVQVTNLKRSKWPLG